jgi:MoaA/NifB/PqqE/SkfB family radical SAM enzyme
VFAPKETLVSGPLIALTELAIRNKTIRRSFLKVAKKKLYEEVVVKNVTQRPRQVQEEKYIMMRNMLDSMDRLFQENRISKQALNGLLKILVGEILLNDIERRKKAYQEKREAFPGFLTISPTKACNLCCKGCYAASSSKDQAKLDYEVFHRIIDEKTRFWRSHFTVISGGEPFLYQDKGKGILDIARDHSDNYFLVYTNGTLIDRTTAAEMAEVGNITPAISVEGLEEETDFRRGKGVHRRILRAFENLRVFGVPFGISVTATKHNAELVVSDQFIDFYFSKQGAVYAWIFQYMPIGRKYDVNLMITPEQRLYMLQREGHFIRDRGVFIADFWNSGPVSNGCIAAGRDGGYFYIDWNGDVMPCVFFPYTMDNIVEIYRRGEDLNAVLNSPLFEAIRRWQEEYSYMKPAHQVGNQIIPCPIRDHYGRANDVVKNCRAKPADEAAEDALGDEEYCQAMICYGQRVSLLTDGYWDQKYIAPERSRWGERGEIISEVAI